MQIKSRDATTWQFSQRSWWNVNTRSDFSDFNIYQHRQHHRELKVESLTCSSHQALLRWAWKLRRWCERDFEIRDEKIPFADKLQISRQEDEIISVQRVLEFLEKIAERILFFNAASCFVRVIAFITPSRVSLRNHINLIQYRIVSLACWILFPFKSHPLRALTQMTHKKLSLKKCTIVYLRI